MKKGKILAVLEQSKIHAKTHMPELALGKQSHYMLKNTEKINIITVH